MMKKFLFFLLVLFYYQYSSSQISFCDNQPSFSLNQINSHAPVQAVSDLNALQYLKVEIIFLQNESGENNYTEYGSHNVPATDGAYYNYNGQDYANDLVEELNYHLSFNAPPNICDGWQYYLNPNLTNEKYLANQHGFSYSINGQTGQIYNPDHANPLEDQDFPFETGIRVYLENVSYLKLTGLENLESFGQVWGSLIEMGYDYQSDDALKIYIAPNSFKHSVFNGSVIGLSNGTSYTAKEGWTKVLLHEIGHALGLWHGAFKLKCQSGDCNQDGCGFFAQDENGNNLLDSNDCPYVFSSCDYDSEGWLNSSSIHPEECNAGQPNCSNIQISYSLNANSPHTDQIYATACPNLWDAASSEVNGLDENGYIKQYKTPWCDEPNEIPNNVMDFGGTSFTANQLQTAKNLLNGYLIEMKATREELLARDLSELPDFKILPTDVSLSESEIASGTFNSLNVEGGYSSYQWYKNGLEISGATGTSFTPDEAAEYKIVVENDLGSIGIDKIKIGNINTFPYNQNFDNFTYCYEQNENLYQLDQSISNGTCQLEGFWINSDQDDFDWGITKGKSWFNHNGAFLNDHTGLYNGNTSRADHGTLSGNFIYLESTLPDNYQTNPSGYSAELISPNFDFTNTCEPKLSFWYFMNGNNGLLEIHISNDNGLTWNLIDSFDSNEGEHWIEYSTTLSLAELGSETQFKLVGKNGFSEEGIDIGIDDFAIYDGYIEADEISIVCAGETVEIIPQIDFPASSAYVWTNDYDPNWTETTSDPSIFVTLPNIAGPEENLSINYSVQNTTTTGCNIVWHKAFTITNNGNLTDNPYWGDAPIEVFEACEDHQITLTVPDIDLDKTYYWSNDYNDWTATGSSVNFEFNSIPPYIGNLNIFVEAVDNDNSCTYTHLYEIIKYRNFSGIKGADPNNSPIANGQLLCGPVELNGSYISDYYPNTSVQWYKDDQPISSTPYDCCIEINTPCCSLDMEQIIAEEPGTYRFDVAIGDNCLRSYEVVIGAAPGFDFEVDCMNNTINLSAEDGFDSYTWIAPDGSFFNGNNQIIPFNATDDIFTGEWQVEIEGSTCHPVNNFMLDPLSNTLETNMQACFGEPVNLMSCLSQSDNVVSHSWTGPYGFSSTEVNPVIDFINSFSEGIYALTVEYNNGCTAQELINLDVTFTPFDLTISNEVICLAENQTIIVEALTNEEVLSVEWTSNVPNSIIFAEPNALQTEIASFNNTGSPFIVCNITFVSGCTESEILPIQIVDYPNLEIFTSNSNICPNETFNLWLGPEYQTLGSTGNWTYSGPDTDVQLLPDSDAIGITVENLDEAGLHQFEFILQTDDCTISEIAEFEMLDLQEPQINLTPAISGEDCILQVVINNFNPNETYNWYWSTDGLNFNLLPDENSDHFVPENSGYYYAESFNGSCYNASNTVLLANDQIPLKNSNEIMNSLNDGIHSIVDNIKILGNIYVGNGKSLIIEQGAVVEFADNNSGIWIMPGGKLIVDDASLTGNSCSNKSWRGINVMGNPSFELTETVDYLSIDESHENPEHGIVVIRNNSIIEDAQYAIQAKDFLNDDVLVPTEPQNYGIVYLHNSTLKNNWHDVSIYRTPEMNHNNISNCLFVKDQLFKGSESAQYRGIYLSYVSMFPIANNIFRCDFEPSDFGYNNIRIKGQGIISYYSDFNIDNNTIVNLYKGIDVFDSFSASTAIIQNNLINNVRQGITSNSTTLLSIENNELTNIPQGSAEEQAFGICMYDSFGFGIRGNSIKAVENDNDPLTSRDYQFGLFIRNSDAMQSLGSPLSQDIHENEFHGRFRAATIFQGTHSNLNTTCNYYLDNSKTDWLFLSNTDPAGNDLEDFAVVDSWDCIEEADGTPNVIVNKWHDQPEEIPIGYDIGHHIENLAPANNAVFLGYREDSEPTRLSGRDNAGNLTNNVDDIINLNMSDTYCANQTNCEQSFEDESNPPSNCNKYTAAQYRSSIRENTKAFVLQELICAQTLWTKPIITSSFIKSNQLEEAQFHLNQIPLETAEQISMVNFYQEAIDLKNATAGKSLDQMDKIIEESNHHSVATMAQSKKAQLQEIAYSRHVSLPKDQLINNLEEQSIQFTLFPNPAENLVNLDLKQLDPSNKWSVEIYNNQNKLLYSHTFFNLESGSTSIDVSNYSNGIYFCKMINELGKTRTAKFVIMK